MSTLGRLAYRLRFSAHPYSSRELDAYWLGAFRLVKDEHMGEVDALVLKVWIYADRPPADGPDMVICEPSPPPRQWRPRKQVTLVGDGSPVLLYESGNVRWRAIHRDAGWAAVREEQRPGSVRVCDEWLGPPVMLLDEHGRVDASVEKVELPVVEQRQIRSEADRLWATTATVRSSDLAKALLDGGGWFRRGDNYMAAKRALTKALVRRAGKLERRGLLHRMVLPQEEEWHRDPDGCWMLTDDGFTALLGGA